MWTRNWSSEISGKCPNFIYLLNSRARIPVQFCLTQIIFYISSKHSMFIKNQEAKFPCYNTLSPLQRSIEPLLLKILTITFICLIICQYTYLYSSNPKRMQDWILKTHTLYTTAKWNKNEARHIWLSCFMFSLTLLSESHAVSWGDLVSSAEPWVHKWSMNACWFDLLEKLWLLEKWFEVLSHPTVAVLKGCKWAFLCSSLHLGMRHNDQTFI